MFSVTDGICVRNSGSSAWRGLVDYASEEPVEQEIIVEEAAGAATRSSFGQPSHVPTGVTRVRSASQSSCPDDVDLDHRRVLVVEAHLDLVEPRRLDRVGQLDLLLRDLEAFPVDRVCDVLSGDRAE